MGMPATNAQEWTAEMFDDLPDDGNRYEIIDGELFVTPAPNWSHQAVVAELFYLFETYLRRHSFARVLFSPADIRIDRRNVVQPDLFVTPLIDGRSPRSWKEVTSLLLAIEVLSPTSARADRACKRPLYQRFNVPEYWIVDADARLIERWRPLDDRPEILDTKIEWRPEGNHPPLVIHLPAFFKRVHDE